VLPKLAGCVNFSRNFTHRSLAALLSTVTMLVLFTSPTTQFNIRELHWLMGAVRVLHVLTTSQFADIFTKGLPTIVFSSKPQESCSSLSKFR
jgi:hypothetical protein